MGALVTGCRSDSSTCRESWALIEPAAEKLRVGTGGEQSLRSTDCFSAASLKVGPSSDPASIVTQESRPFDQFYDLFKLLQIV